MAAEHIEACPPLAGRAIADVCVVGGGYTGLWSALELKRLAPELRVTVLEASACGFGASGRNGGWATSWFDELDRLVDRFGASDGLALADESSSAVREIGEFAADQGFDCDFRPRGSLSLATSPDEEAALDRVLATCREHGRAGLAAAIDADEVRRLTGTGLAHRGLLLTDSAAVQPALLARGLRRVALRAGVTIHECTPMLALGRTSPARIQTPAGTVEADQVVLASGAWAARTRELRRSVIVVASQVLITEPLGERICKAPWAAGLLLGDARMLIHYAQVTPCGRIAFGRGGGAISAGGRVIPKHFLDPQRATRLRSDFDRWFPQLAGVRTAATWGGPVDRAPGHLPFVGALGEARNIHYGLGYSGNGVGPSRLIAKILARRALGIAVSPAHRPLISGPPGYLPAEPLRFIGAAAVRGAVTRAEEHEDAGRNTPLSGRLAKRLVNFSIPRWRGGGHNEARITSR